MSWCENKMFLGINKWLFCYSIISPKKKYNSLFFFWNSTNHTITKSLPSFFFMGSWFTFSYSQYAIKKEHSLLCPIGQIGICTLYCNIWIQFLKDISKTGLDFWTWRYGKRESHSSTSRMIGILTQNYDFHRIKWRRIKCTKNIFSFWKTDMMKILLFHKVSQRIPIRFLKFRGKNFMPWWMYANSHSKWL